MTMAGAEFWQRAFAARDKRTAKIGLFSGTIVYGFTIFITTIIGMSAAVLFPDLLATYGTADYAIPVMVASILPPVLTGLTFAGVLSVMMSSADTCILVASQAIVSDLFKTVSPSMTEKRQLSLSRITTIIISVFALITALFYTSAYDALMFAWTFYAASMGIPTISALFWKDATRAGTMAGIIAGFLGSVGWKWMGQPFNIGSTFIGVLLSGVFLVFVSLLTKKTSPSRPIPFAKLEQMEQSILDVLKL